MPAAPVLGPAIGCSRGLSGITVETALAVDLAGVIALTVVLHTPGVGRGLAGETIVAAVISYLSGVIALTVVLRTLGVGRRHVR